jgi:UPF0716 protein FxsA
VLLLVALFIVVPLLEIYVIIQVGGAIGTGPTVAILLADSVLGAVLLRSQGRGAWVRFNRALAESRMPAKEVFDGVLIIFGGALLLTPGFITDVVGLLLLIPPSRALVRAASRRLVVGRLAMGPRAATWGFGRARERRARRRPAPGAEPDPRTRPPGGPAREDASDWDEALFPGRARRQGPQPGDIEGTGQEVRDQDLPPAEGESPPR